MLKRRDQRTLIASERMEIEFGESPFDILRILNRATGEDVCRGGRQSFLLRTPLDVSEPIFLNRLVSVKTGKQKLQFLVSDAGGQCTLRCTISVAGGALCFQVDASAPQPVWMIEWQLSGLLLREIIAPALGGQVLDERMPVGKTLSYKYPFWWNAQFAVGRMKRGCIWIETKNTDPHFSLLRVRREKGSFALTYGQEAHAPLRATRLNATWYLDAFRGGWRVPVDIHRRWMEKAFHLRTLAENPWAPHWMKEIDFVLELWGMRKDQPQPHHTFDQMKLRIAEWAELHPPKKTLLYLPGFANQGIDSRAPDYEPSPFLGGRKKFRELVSLAHRMGYRVMVHTNALAMTFSHPLYPKFKKHQVTDAFGRPMTWGLDMDGDWLPEPYFAYINPGVKAWSTLMAGVLGELIRGQMVDAVFIDQTLLAFNNDRGPSFLRGMQQHIRRLHRAFPNVLFAGEGLHEQVVRELPMAQIHGIDSITEVHGLESGGAKWRRVHPVSVYLFGKYTRFVPHLLTQHPSHPMWEFQERSYSKLGIMPALSLYDASQPMATPAVRRMIRRARGI